MRYDFLSEPISEDDPCGPDLEEAFDQKYTQWTGEASGLVPERYFTPRMGGGVTVFDRATIDFGEQERRMIELLKRSRDLRLVVLDARFQLLAGNLVGFSEALEAVRILATTFWEKFHPIPFDGGDDYVMRVNTLEALNDNALIIPALQTVPLVKGRAQITYRNFLVATEAITPYEGEEVMNRDFVSRMLSPPEGSPEAEPTRNQLAAMRDAGIACITALAAIRQVFIDQAGHVNAPKFEVRYPGAKGIEQITGLEPALKAIVDFLKGYLGEAVTADGAEGAAEGEAAGAPALAGGVETHASAAAALSAVESYFLKMEPSSPALILVHQARLLIGRPLVEALETLLPEPSTRASVRFDSGYRFTLDLARLKVVTDNLLSSAAAQSSDVESWPSPESGYAATEETSADSDGSGSETAAEEAPADTDSWGSSESSDAPAEEAAEAAPPATLPVPVGTTVDLKSTVTFTAATRLDAGRLLGAVENFFRMVEPSSPIPTLLVRARSYFGKDFAAILNEMMPPDPVSGSE